MAQAWTRTETVQAAQVTGTLTDFPALFSRTHNDFRTIGNGGHVANANGYDLLLYSDVGLTTPLKMETDLYVAATGQVIKWAKVPSMATSTAVYWGYGDTTIVTSQDDAPNVWPNYAAVLHLGDGSTLSVTDSTGITIPTNHSVTATTGKISGGGAFGTARSIDLGTPSALQIVATPITIAVWASPSSFPGLSTMIDKGYDGSKEGYTLRFNSSTELYVGSYDGSSHAATWTIPAGEWNTGVWRRAVGLWNGSLWKLFVDGALKASSGATAGPFATTEHAWIGAFSNGGTSREFAGSLDEPSIYAGGWSDDRVAADFNNQSAPTSFWALGSEAPIGGAGGGSVGGYPAWQASVVAA